MTSLPPQFVSAIEEHYGAVGRTWLDRLPTIIGSYCHCWQLTRTDTDVINGGRSVVLRCRDMTDRAVALKLAPDHFALQREASGLRHWAPSGRVPAVLYGNGDNGAFVLEELHETEFEFDSDAAFMGVSAIMAALHSLPCPEHGMSTARHITNLLSGAFSRVTAPNFAASFPQELRLTSNDIAVAMNRMGALIASQDNDALTLLHGDLHERNLMRCPAGNLVAIDPKPFLGERALDVALMVRCARAGAELGETLPLVADLFAVDLDRLRTWTQVVLLDAIVIKTHWSVGPVEEIADLTAFMRAAGPLDRH